MTLSNLVLNDPWLIGILLHTVLIAIAFVIPKKLLTPAGYVNAWLLGVILWAGLGWRGYILTLFYLFVGSAVTKVGFAQKEAEGTAEARGGIRGPGNVWGSALTGAVCALVIVAIELALVGRIGDLQAVQLYSIWPTLLVLGFVASLSTKLSDTTATEIGKAYGKRTFLITTLQPVPRGTEGAVSLEGTAAGVVASIVLAMVAWFSGLISLAEVGICAIAAFGATTIESIIGATIEEKLAWLTHDLVNIINTTIGAVLAIGIGLFVL